MAEAFTGLPGSFVSIEECLDGFEGILEGKYDSLPEEAFRNVGNIDQVIAKARDMGVDYGSQNSETASEDPNTNADA